MEKTAEIIIPIENSLPVIIRVTRHGLGKIAHVEVENATFVSATIPVSISSGNPVVSTAICDNPTEKVIFAIETRSDQEIRAGVGIGNLKQYIFNKLHLPSLRVSLENATEEIKGLALKTSWFKRFSDV